MNFHTKTEIQYKKHFTPHKPDERKSLYINIPNGKSLCMIYRNASSLFLGLISEKYYNKTAGEQAFCYRKILNETEEPLGVPYAIIRDPVERFISAYALRSLYRDGSIDDLLEKLETKEKEKIDLHFRPQYILIGNFKPKLFNFKTQLNELAEELELTTPLPTINKTDSIIKPNLSKVQIDRIYNFYKEDKDLYDGFKHI